ncbi:glycosyltransferase family 4 protein [Aurantimonas endophytica]|uniref:Glycosyltransferase involved in cell wall biosynthesis n=1 Tax=Aurantimonas endophytica TaxID=1522175 RepID=A0A7W6MRC9_9HYPH|nr:glycosyltransferase family 4 protein [Aurantimonas endophytica]MBB4004833.1 glycosyltransferase involved in cell wall biosynthesis [Aurantimonas endophytica]MCO6405643.1 glycosyltransferase [Aurantimonas endophytica]
MAAPKRVLIAINTSWNIFNFRAGLIRGLRERGYEVIAVAPHDAYAPRLAELGCRYVPLPMDNKGTSPLKDLALAIRFWRLLRRERPDVFLGYTIKPNVYGSVAARLLGIPVINNIAGLGTAFIRENWLTRLVKGLYRAGLAGSKTIFFQNEDDRALFVGNGIVRKERTALLPGSGIDLHLFAPEPEPGSGAPFSFLLVARLLWDKGVGEYVEAARLVREKRPDVQFRLLGFLDVVNRTAIPQAAVDAWVQEGIIDYLGSCEDVRPHLAEAHCVVLPSYREGTPRTLLEAASMAKPLIATDVPGCRQVVDDGENGYLCRPRDVPDLAAKMLAMLALGHQDLNSMGLAGRLKMEREFDEAIVLAQYLKAIEAALQPRAARNAPAECHQT